MMNTRYSIQHFSSNACCKKSRELPDISDDSSSSGMYPKEESRQLSRDLHDHVMRKNHGGVGGGKRVLRTPRSLTRLMQQHRDNERHRHRGLNASIKAISKCIPGYDESIHDTKIGKLQRIINYICHLEGHIHNLCQDVGLDLEFKNLFLSPHLSENDKKKASTYHGIYTLPSGTKENLQKKSVRGSRQLKSVPSPISTLINKRRESSCSEIDHNPDVVFPGSSAYDPFASSSARVSYDLGIPGNGTPPHGDEWNNGDDVISFLSPDVATFLQNKGYYKVLEELDLSSPIKNLSDMISIEPGQESADSSTEVYRNVAANSSGMTLQSDGNLSMTKQDYVCAEYQEFVSLIPEQDVQPMYGIANIQDNPSTAYNEFCDGIGLPDIKPFHHNDDDNDSACDLEYPLVTFKKSGRRRHTFGAGLGMKSTASSKKRLPFSEPVVDNPDITYMVPHLEGVDQSDDEDLDGEMSPNKPCGGQVHQQMNGGCTNTFTDARPQIIFPGVKVEREEAIDELFNPHLQKIEEDDNDYYQDSGLLCTQSSGDLSDQPLFAMSMILKDAGLSPQYKKAGTSHFSGLTPVCSPINSPPAIRSWVNQCTPSFHSPPQIISPLASHTLRRFRSPTDIHKQLEKFLNKLHVVPVIEPSGLNTSGEDSGHSMDVSLASDTTQKCLIIGRQSTPVDSDYGSVLTNGVQSNENKPSESRSPLGESLAKPSLTKSTKLKEAVDSPLVRKGSAVDCEISENYDSSANVSFTSDQGPGGNSLNDIMDVPRSKTEPNKVRIDNRKISWMNGFMMFSRLNRKDFLKRNPGMHTSHISKLLGQEWRQLSAADKTPYQEKAKLYAQKVLTKAQLS